MPPMRFGIKNTVRNIFVPRMPRVRAYATAKDRTLIKMSEVTAKIAVYQKACRKLGSLKALT